MATRARNAAAEFFTAAHKALDDKAAAEKKLREENRKAEAAQAAFARREAKKLDAAFTDYRKKLAPLLEAMEALPARDGEKFMVRVDRQLHKEWTTKEEKRSMWIWIAYSRPLLTDEDRKKYKPASTPMPSNGIDTQLDARPHENGRRMLSLRLDYDSMVGGEQLRGGRDTSYFDTLKSMDDIPAYIGKWVAENAPERLNDLKKALGVKSARKLPAPKP